ncbi:MAG: UDP-N-acetylmuramate dehydrogenase [Candidatus Omnitrophica bacterium]|nr:UDP-N-acetylmuramate dehydrogenase [Candidatus Omnitrophota bacterium]
MSDKHLSSCTTFQLGGAAKGIIHCQTSKEVEHAVRQLNSLHEPFILIGGGSNLVVSDQGLNCFVIRYVSESPVIRLEGNELMVGAGTVLDQLALFSASCGLSGLIFTSGIPGTVGGAVVGNAGAFGKQVGDVLVSATVLDLKGRKRTIKNEDFKFEYRHSALKETQEIVLEVVFKVQPSDPLSLLQERGEILKIRHDKHPNLKEYPCAGSFFRNIEPTSKAERRQATGWFLEQAGGKSLTFGGAIIYPKHANIIVKSNGCCSQDVYELSKLMANLAKDHFNLDLEREVRFVGDFKGKPSHLSNDIIW